MSIFDKKLTDNQHNHLNLLLHNKRGVKHGKGVNRRTMATLCKAHLAEEIEGRKITTWKVTPFGKEWARRWTQKHFIKFTTHVFVDRSDAKILLRHFNDDVNRIAAHAYATLAQRIREEER